MDDTTDAGNIEDELIVIMTFYKNDMVREVKSVARYLSVEIPKKADADCLILCLQRSLQAHDVEKIYLVSKVCCRASLLSLVGVLMVPQ